MWIKEIERIIKECDEEDEALKICNNTDAEDD